MKHATALEITVRGHAMATPDVGFLSRPGLLALRDADGPIVFAHADLSGLSLFEEASYWGVLAAGACWPDGRHPSLRRRRQPL